MAFAIGAVRAGADPNAKDVIKIALVTEAGKEKATEILRGSTPDEAVLEQVADVLGTVNVPFIGIRVYRGFELIHDEEIEVR